MTTHELDFVKIRAPRQSLGAISLALAEHAFADSEGESPLLALTPPRKGESIPSAQSDASDGYSALLDLLRLAARARVRVADSAQTAPAVHPFLRLVLFERFLGEVESLVASARPAYHVRTEVLSAPRGRLLDADLLEAIHTHRPEVVCRFDDLSFDSPLLQVVRAAVAVVATSSVPNALRDLNGSHLARGAFLLRRLGLVTVLPRSEAVRLSTRLRLSRMDQAWAATLALARQVLTDDLQRPDGRLGNAQSLSMQVPTDKLWEQILAQALRLITNDIRVSADNKAAPGVIVPPPWASTQGVAVRGRYPDFMARICDLPTVLDAKYKLLRGGLMAGDDADQLFVYSHLAALDGDPVEFAAVLSVDLPDRPVTSRVLFRSPQANFRLALLGVPFPGRSSLVSERTWSAYISSISSGIRDKLTEASA